MIQRILEVEVMDTEEESSEYDAMDHTSANAALVERLAQLGAQGRMLDIGTGPGHIPLLVCSRFPSARVTAIDLALNMLSLANQKKALSPHGERISFELADAKALDFETDSFDVVYSNTILHHIPDPVPFLREAGRVLKTGGTLLIRDLFRPTTEERLAELVALHAAGENALSQELFRASLHAALTHDELRAAADQAGLQAAELVVDSDRHHTLQLAAR